jgi:protein CpxP
MGAFFPLVDVVVDLDGDGDELMQKDHARPAVKRSRRAHRNQLPARSLATWRADEWVAVRGGPWRHGRVRSRLEATAYSFPPFHPLHALLAVLFAAGCTAECRELEPVAEVRQNLREQVDERLDEVDVSEAQRTRIQALFARALPARMQFRKETVPLLHQLVSELRRDAPDRQVQAALIAQLADSGEHYGQLVADIMIQAHAVLTPAQRKKLAVKSSEPSPAFDGSWFLDRGIDLLMLRIHANDAQEALVDRMKQRFVQQARAVQRKLDTLRVEAAAEFIKDKPDPVRIHATLKRARVEAERFMIEIAGYQQLLASKLDSRQRMLLNAELVRLEVCPEATRPGGKTL